jgi:2-polyprenyl-3-methyl-5-hydroxy-6-metoxy-1,4-benzoquinol methylase
MTPTHKCIPGGRLRCLLCDHDILKIVWALTGHEIRALWQVLGHELSEEAYGNLGHGCRVEQYECENCGFRFFDPHFAGQAKFYEELAQDGYYVAARPEFEFTLRLCAREGASTLLDVGGGAGAFVDRAREARITTYVLEMNAHAAATCAANGHRVLQKKLEETTLNDLDGGVQVLTLFQVLEHVPDPRTFLRHAVRLVRSGGLVIVAVPNNLGVHTILPFDPANMPPHHISRWRVQDLEQLARALNLTVAARGADMLYGESLRQFWELHNQLAAAIGRRRHPGGQWLPKSVTWLYRKLGCRHYLPRKGLSIYAAYRIP